MSFKQFDKSYEPHEVEKRWYAYWENEQLFAADDQSPRKNYAIVIPAAAERRAGHVVKL